MFLIDIQIKPRIPSGAITLKKVKMLKRISLESHYSVTIKVIYNSPEEKINWDNSRNDFQMLKLISMRQG